MNYIDIVIIITFSYATFKGFVNGFIKEITGVVSLIIGTYLAINFSIYLEPLFVDLLKKYTSLIPLLSFLVLFLSTIISLKALGYFFEKITNALSLSIVGNFLGAIFGFLKVFVAYCFLIFFLKDSGFVSEKTKKESILYIPLTNYTTVFTPKIQGQIKIIEKKANETKEKIEKKLSPDS